MKNSRTSLAGAFAALGVFLFGVPVMVSLSSIDFPGAYMKFFLMAGILCQAAGIFIGHLMAPDAKAVKELADKVDQNSVAIETTVKAVEGNDTTHLSRKIAENRERD